MSARGETAGKQKSGRMSPQLQSLKTMTGRASDAWKPYPKYKESGVIWLDKVPKHWRMRRTKTLLRERVQKGFPSEPLLAATQTQGVVQKEKYENRTALAMKDLHLLKLVCAVISLSVFVHFKAELNMHMSKVS